MCTKMKKKKKNKLKKLQQKKWLRTLQKFACLLHYSESCKTINVNLFVQYTHSRFGLGVGSLD